MLWRFQKHKTIGDERFGWSSKGRFINICKENRQKYIIYFGLTGFGDATYKEIANNKNLDKKVNEIKKELETAKRE